jgi:ribonucleoside-diphosphate reductase alpha chain
MDNNIYLCDGNKKIILDKDYIHNYVLDISNAINLDVKIAPVVDYVYPKLKNINTVEEFESQIIFGATELATTHYTYPKISVYILISNLHKNTSDDFLDLCTNMMNTKNIKGNIIPLLNESYYNFVSDHVEKINNIIDYQRDYRLTIFGYRTLERAYLKKNHLGKIYERPQHLFMRVAIALHYRSKKNINNIFEMITDTYNALSLGYFTHATPTLFNAGTNLEQLSSCFLFGLEDSIESISKSWSDCAITSKNSGGIGIGAQCIRCIGSFINSTQGPASGLKVLNVYNEIARYADQGGKRLGSIAIYLEPWHGDIIYFLELKKNTGAETDRARDLFFGLMINDIFMRRAENDEIWSLFCPNRCPNLLNKYGKEFEEAYIYYEKYGMYEKQMKARDLFKKIVELAFESGGPYWLFKDAINNKSNQINIGVVNNSNLCAEIVEVSTTKEYACCVLSSICLPKFIKKNELGILYFDHKLLYRMTRLVTRNLDNIIDINLYPVVETKKSNSSHRPVAVGVQGLADVFLKLKYPFDSDEAVKLNKHIFETIYYAALSESIKLAKETSPYSSYVGSPISKGILQFDMWGIKQDQLSGLWDWNKLRQKIFKYGVRNSLLTACMPTASTSQIMGNNECIEPYTQNIYTRSTLGGTFYVVNKYLMKELLSINMWNPDVLNMIKYYHGSIANIPGISNEIKKIYRTVWEIDQLSLIDMAADRGPFIDQTQSMNIFMRVPNFHDITKYLFRGWYKGLKTGMYYLRTMSGSDAFQFGIDIDKIKEIEGIELNSSGTLTNSDFETQETPQEKPSVCYRGCEACEG